MHPSIQFEPNRGPLIGCRAKIIGYLSRVGERDREVVMMCECEFIGIEAALKDQYWLVDP